MRLLTHEHDEVLVSRVGASRAGWVERFTQFVAVQGITTRNVVRPFELQRERVFITTADFSGAGRSRSERSSRAARVRESVATRTNALA